MVQAFKKRKGKRLVSKIDSTILRGFGGGWNAIDEDLSMQPKYQVKLVNFRRTSSGSQAVRFGQTFNCDIKAVRNSPIVDGIYFNAFNIVVTESGNVLKVSGDGTIITEIWNTAIAAALPGAPSAWPGGITQVSFVPFKDTLIIHNGLTKPIVISSSFTVKYLQDDATGSNVNVPIGRYGCVAANYHCVANIVYTGVGGVITDLKPTQIFISAKGVSGVFENDPDSDGISFDVGAYAPEGAASIRGIAGFRTYLLVFLQNITLQIKLGEYSDATPAVHTPKFPDTLPQFGILGNRTIVTVENDIMFAGLSGLASAKRNLYAPDSITSDYLSSIVAPAYRSIVGALDDNAQLNEAFAVHDHLNNNYKLFMPNGHVLVYTHNARLKMNSWSEFEDMDFHSGWTSILGRVFLSKGTKIFTVGNDTFAGENYYADLIGDRDTTFTNAASNYVVNELVFDSITGLVWKNLTAHAKLAGITFEQERFNNPSMWSLYEGKPILVDFELPWIDGKDPMQLKQLRYISIATKGDAEFTFEAYVDNLYKDVHGDVIYLPGVSMTFIGNDAFGFGFDDTPYGMGRRSRDPRLYGLPLKFKTIKFRITGSTTKKLELVNLSFLFARNKQHGYHR